MSHVLEVKNLKTYFFMHDHVIKAVDGVDFYLDANETVGLVGESGCGKSVTSLSLLRLIPNPPGKIVQGSILFENKDLVTLSEKDLRSIRGNRISMIFQEPMTSLNPVFTVGNQICEVLREHRDMSKKDALAEAIRLLTLVGISEPKERVHEYPFQLSGGLRQRIMISMALACQPAVLIADEPTTALDVTIQAQILRLMRDVRTKINSSIIFITHDLAVIAQYADRVIVMYAGVVVEIALVREMFKATAHPYSQGLLASIPVLGRTKKMSDGTMHLLSMIPGTLPDPKSTYTGCRFSSRCSKAFPKCFQHEPALTQLSNTHWVRCFLFADTVQVDSQSHGTGSGSNQRE